VLVVRSAVDHIAAREQDVEVQQGVVHQTKAMRRCLNADAGRSTSCGDGLELRNHCGHDTPVQCLRDQFLIGRHAFDVDPAVDGIDVQYMAEAAQIQPALGYLASISKQVGAALFQTQWRTIDRDIGPYGGNQCLPARSVGRQFRLHTGTPGSSGSWSGSRCPC